MANGSSSSWVFGENTQIRTTIKVFIGAVLVGVFFYKLHDNLVSAIDRNGSRRWDQLDEFHGDQVRKKMHPEYPALELQQIQQIADMNED
jgi:hypothetical protein